MAALLLVVAGSLATATPVPMRELGAYDISTAETTPFLWYGDLLIVEKVAGSAVTIWRDGDICKPGSTNGTPGVPPCTSRGSVFRIRKQSLLGHGSNDLVDTGGGVAIVPGSKYKSFASAYVDETTHPARPTLFVFGTSDCVGWNAPISGCAFNLSLPGHPWMPCECPSGTVERGEVWAMWTNDPLLSEASWQYKKVLQLPPQIGVCNTDVTKGPNGTHVMALEMITEIDGHGGMGYTSIFAQTGADPSTGWKLMNPQTFTYAGASYGHSVSSSHDYACPTIRYLPSDGYFYLVSQMHYQRGQSGDRVLPGRYPCCFTEWIARSKDLSLNSWTDSTSNPIMGFPGPHAGTGNGSLPSEHLGAGDTTVQSGSVLDVYGSAVDQEICRNKTDQINRSDGDWVELPASYTSLLGLQGPAVYIVWVCGDQDPGSKSPNFGCSGIVNGTQDQWLQSYF